MNKCSKLFVAFVLVSISVFQAEAEDAISLKVGMIGLDLSLIHI